MRIGFDVSQTAERMAGCGIVADQFLRHLVPASPADFFIAYPLFGNYRNPEFARATCPDAPNVVSDQFRLTWTALNEGWDGPPGDLWTFLGEPDVVHANNYFCPRGLQVPVIYTIYDLSQIECPEFHTEQNRLVCFNGLYDASLHADHMIAISEHSRRRFLKWFPHVAPERVSVVHLAARRTIAAPMADETVASVLRTFDLTPGGFWLAVGTIEPRKNYALLLEAYAGLLAELPRHDATLCIVGQAGWIESSLAPRIRRLGLGDRVRCLGFVDDAELAALYRGCFAFAYPSLYEGFGLPIVEAQACGAAVIAMRSTSLPEVVGDAGILVPPESPAAYLAAMKQLVVEPGLRADLRAAAPSQAARFSWDRSARTLLDVYRAVGSGRSRTARNRGGMSRLRIAVDVTPIREGDPNAGVTPFVLELLTSFATAPLRHEYRLLTAAHNHHAFSSYEALGMTRCCVEGTARPLGLRAGGIDVLFCPLTGPTFAEEGVRSVCTVYDLAHLGCPWFFDPIELARRMAVHDEVVARADHVVCTSELARIGLIRHLGVAPERTSVVPMAIRPMPRYEEEAAWRALAAYPLPRCRFAFYPADFSPRKNHRLLLVAFGAFLREHPEADLHLVLTGDRLGGDAALTFEIERMALSSRVHVLGRVPDAHMPALWSAASLLVFPGLFEGFATPVVEAMHYGKPVVCSRDGSLPEAGGDEAVYFDARSPQALMDALAMAIQHPDEMQRRAGLARARLAAYGAEAVAAQYLDVFARAILPLAAGVEPLGPERREDGRLLTPVEAYVRYFETNRDVEELRAELHNVRCQLAESDADRAARLVLIHRMGDELGRISVLEADIEYLKGRVVTAEGRLATGDADRAARLAADLAANDAVWAARLAESEADRAARLEVIYRQGEEIGLLSTRLTDLAFLKQQVRTLRARRSAPRALVRRIVNRVRRAVVARSARGSG